MFLERAHPVTCPRCESLDTAALRLFGRVYTELTDDQANAVWDAIEENES